MLRHQPIACKIDSGVAGASSCYPTTGAGLQNLARRMMQKNQESLHKAQVPDRQGLFCTEDQVLFCTEDQV
jgi:hypothetical protein